MVEVLLWIVFGLVVGVVARLILPGRDPIGIIGTIVLGVVGGLAGGYLWRAIFGDTEDMEWIGAIIMAVLLLAIYRSMTYRRGAVR